MSLCQPVIWSMAAILRDSTVVVVVVVAAAPAVVAAAVVRTCMGCLWGSAGQLFGPPELRYKHVITTLSDTKMAYFFLGDYNSL